MFASQLGYALVVESTFARWSRRRCPRPRRCARPAALPATAPFTPRTYVHLALVCAALLAPGVGEQILISALVDQIRADAAEQSVTGHRRHQRPAPAGDRPQAARGLGRGDRDRRDRSTAWGERREDEALLSINRPLLIHLLPSPLHQFDDGRGHLVTASTPSRRAGGSGSGWWRTRPCSGPSCRTTSSTCCPGSATSWPGSWMRTSGWCWRSGPRARWPTIRPAGRRLTDLDFPGSGSAKQAALLLLDELSTALQPSAGSARSSSAAALARPPSRPGRRSTRCSPSWPPGTGTRGRPRTASPRTRCGPTSWTLLEALRLAVPGR